MGPRFRSLPTLVLLIWFFWWSRVEAQSPKPESNPERDLDAILQDYAYRAFLHARGRTGLPYKGDAPSKLPGIQISAMRLRSGSLYTRGVEKYEEFKIPVHVTVQPYVERLILVYQNLAGFSTTYYPLPGYTYLAPVLGLLAYNAEDLSAKNLPELKIFRATGKQIAIKFKLAGSVPHDSVAKCVWFDLTGKKHFSDVAPENTCLTFEQGHFGIVVESTGPSAAPSPAPPLPQLSPPPSGNGNDSRVWIIIGSVVGGLALLVLLAFLILWVWRFKKRKKMHRMEKAADAGEALHLTTIGRSKAPAAATTRTQPALETEYVP